MEIVHHVGFSHKDGVDPVLDRLGVRYKKTPGIGDQSYLGTFDISESDAHWTEIEAIIKTKSLLDLPMTRFTEREVLSAEWLRMLPGFQQGYPQPESKWKEVSMENGCPKCGVGIRQKHPLCIKREPQLGKRDFMSLYWTAVLFATQRVFAALQSVGLQGYQRWPVRIQSSGQPSQTVSQIYVAGEASAGLLSSDSLGSEVCSVCGQTKPHVAQRGMIRYRRGALPEQEDFMRSHEWFGSGGFAFQETFVSHRVARLVVEQRWQGVVLQPLELG